MNKKALAIIICLVLVLSLFSGCAESKPAETTEPAQTTETTEPAETAQAPEADESEAPAAENVVPDTTVSEANTTIEAVSAEEAGITYPLCDPNEPLEFTQFNPWPSLFDVTGYTEWNELPILDTIQELTGVKYRFITVSTTAQTEQFNLMMASGDWCDVINAADYYTGGQQQAYAEDIIYDLTDILPEAAPNYYNLLMDTNQSTIDLVLQGGRHLGMNVLYTDPYKDQGPLYRGDWLEEMGVGVPTNFEEFDKVLYYFKDKATKGALYVSYTGSIDGLGNIFDCSIFDVSGNATGCAMNLDVLDGTYRSDLVTDNYRNYLEYFIQLYKDGVIADDFYTLNYTDTEKEQAAGKNEFGMWLDWANNMYVTLDYAVDSSFSMVPAGKLLNDEGLYTYGSNTTLADNKGYNITTQCEEPELLCSFWNYFYTDEGMVYANYGIEGLSWEYDDAGIRQYTEYITNNPDGINSMIVKIVNMFSQTPMLKDNMASINSDYDAAGLEAIEVWSDLSNQVAYHAIPAAAELNTEESNSIATTQTDIITYATEAILKFMTGTEELNDANWDAYCDQCYKLGLQDVIDVYQNAYEEYLRGERVIATSTAGGAGGPPPDGDAGGPPPDMP